MSLIWSRTVIRIKIELTRKLLHFENHSHFCFIISVNCVSFLLASWHRNQLHHHQYCHQYFSSVCYCSNCCHWSFQSAHSFIQLATKSSRNLDMGLFNWLTGSSKISILLWLLSPLTYSNFRHFSLSKQMVDKVSLIIKVLCAANSMIKDSVKWQIGDYQILIFSAIRNEFIHFNYSKWTSSSHNQCTWSINSNLDQSHTNSLLR